ncbi:MAG: hypothetical protein LBM93_05575 [Oscillospiraceae bacterium]|jgi:hypothetical protein|nr:hypothetical protein [Oscillospiraceae bacterium]
MFSISAQIESQLNFTNIWSAAHCTLKTEINHLEQKQLISDLVFLTESDRILHFEFQSTNKKSDLMRFLLSDSYLAYTYDKPIDTLIVYTGEIDKANTSLDFGSVKYGVKVFYMSNFDGDKKFVEIDKKIKNGDNLSCEDMVSIAFCRL